MATSLRQPQLDHAADDAAAMGGGSGGYLPADALAAVSQRDAGLGAALGQSLAAPFERENPFALPTEKEIFAMAKYEKVRKAEERARQKTLRVHEKTTTVRERARIPQGSVIRAKDSALRKMQPDLSRSAPPVVAHERETIQEFIAKKKEMFLLSLSLDTKWSEIQKLEERAQWREEALEKSDKMLVEDSARFEKFLRENDEKAIEATKRAEQESRARQEKVKQAKAIQVEIEHMKNELAKVGDHVSKCLDYERFLQALTPKDWARDCLRLRKEERGVQQWAEAVGADEEVMGIKEVAELAPADRTKARLDELGFLEFLDVSMDRLDGAAAELERVREAAVESGELAEEPIPQFFTEASQLLEVYSDLEQNNLFLIEHSQSVEETLEKEQAKFTEARERMSGQLRHLREQITALEGGIAEQDAKKEEAMKRKRSGAVLMSTGETIEEIRHAIERVYTSSGFELDASDDPLSMVTALEKELDRCQARYSSLPREHVDAAEKALKKEQRETKRLVLLEQQKREQERRIQKVLERSTQPIPRPGRVGIDPKTGKMIRSRLKKKPPKIDDAALREAVDSKLVASFFK